MESALIEEVLREAGARFAFVFGSRARGDHRPGSDLDVAAYFGSATPLELAGRVAVEGVLLFDGDPDARIEWLARTRKVYFDERYRLERAHREFAEAVAVRG
ncbi:MAG: nucleotidyltransferase domain-containing protein [Actinobacteria bacterium]|nr:nucleotidyltransferase domain-containing protein [Actinomycetota bacterium]